MKMFNVDFYVPTRVVFGNGRLDELGEIALPGKKALICVTGDGVMEKTGILGRIEKLLDKNGVKYEVYGKVMPNPTRQGVMEAKELALKNGCDFVIGLGGGSSIDTAKACAMMMKHDGDLWDYASVGTGKKKEVTGAAPVVAISTTAGTGTETDPYCVITNEETGEKIDFAQDAIFPAISFIDPELTMTLPRHLTIYQGFDALFHALECYIVNQNKQQDGGRMRARVHLYGGKMAAGGGRRREQQGRPHKHGLCRRYIERVHTAMICTTSHHIIGQCLGGHFRRLRMGPA
jgi:alcohol dehydrogenase